MSEINICFSCDLAWKRRLDRFLADCDVVNRSAYIRQALDFYRLVLKLNAGQKEPLMSIFEAPNCSRGQFSIEGLRNFK